MLLTIRVSTYLPPSRPYELAHLTLDLIRFARYMLVPKGRLVFFLPTVTEEYDAIDIPKVEGMRELKVGDGSVQEFGPWGRRVGPEAEAVAMLIQAHHNGEGG